MNYLECLHKFVNAHSENFLQSLYAVVESSQIECLECPIEKTSTDNFLIKIYINNIIHNIRTLLLTCVNGSVGNLLHNTDIVKRERNIYLVDNDTSDIKTEGKKDIKNEKDNSNNNINIEDDFLNKCKKVHNIRKSLQNTHIKKNYFVNSQNNILDYYI
ncbi:conserved Plasmodium protein, unknown function [Plasmodium gallinaceum]|uniref:Uncharacterized protein n=1 Tax=Plasmodium gallinaceum TaxID=5849 RepID=A0A1J1GQV8_PLAGA|nr:conserved Plasmodium protein, unknown function [Plasmodium gallinaceum]CRG94896.1 conserved Plasmodium protein, unknown function [Plasmodium gallinaceum]